MEMIDKTWDIAIWIVILIFSASFHEAAHAWVAYRCGDDTAKNMGRVSLNPLVHICPFNSILLPALLFFTVGIVFGGAKPVPIVAYKLRSPDRDLALSSAAGPISNLILTIAAVGLLLLHKQFYQFYSLSGYVFVSHLLGNIILLNLILAIFNLIPISLLDGSRVARYLIPPLRELYDSLDTFGIFILIALLSLFPQLQAAIISLIDLALQAINWLYSKA